MVWKAVEDAPKELFEDNPAEQKLKMLRFM